MSHKTTAAAGKENSPRLTRAAARKRSAETEAPTTPAARKRRVVLAELPHLSNAPSAAPQPRRRILDSRSKFKRKPSREAEEETENPAAAAADDPQICTPYATDIYHYLRSMEAEERRRPLTNYIEAVQMDVTAHMRAILVDWLVEVAEEYRLLSDTLYLTISYVDRFLSRHSLNRQKLQLLGVSCMLIASKYEEIAPPHVESFCYITDNTYTRDEVLTMETDILTFLNFEMGDPTIKTFLRKFNRAAQNDQKSSCLKLEFLGSYLAELSLLDYDCLKYLPSLVAASAVFLARYILNPDALPWNSFLRQQTGYKASELRDCVLAVHNLQLRKKLANFVAISDKYKQHKFKCVSELASLPEIPSLYFEDICVYKL